jgi:HSP20 family protein
MRRVGSTWADPFELLHRDFDRMLSRHLGDGEGPAQGLTAAYPVDIREDQDHVYVDAEMPGFTRDQVDVTLENGVLTLNAERKIDEQPEGQQHLNERRFTRVSRSFTLPNTVDESKVDATLVDGVLKLTLHKREEVKPRRIEIK